MINNYIAHAKSIILFYNNLKNHFNNVTLEKLEGTLNKKNNNENAFSLLFELKQ